MPKRNNIKKGDKFSMLTVIKEISKTTTKRRFLFECECGNKKHIDLPNILSGNTKSCGCERSVSATKHGYTKTHPRLYRIYKNMIGRCYNKNSTSYYKYGENGTVVCKEWNDDMSNFIKWATKNGYTDELTLDRKDSYGNYSPDNCRWITTTEQNRNMPRAKLGKIKVRGVNECSTTGGYRAVISIDNKSITIGRSKTIEGAAKLRNDYIDANSLSHLRSVVL